MARLKRSRRMALVAPLRPDRPVPEPTENDETDHLIEEWIGEALNSREE